MRVYLTLQLGPHTYTTQFGTTHSLILSHQNLTSQDVTTKLNFVDSQSNVGLFHLPYIVGSTKI